ncbi:MAG: hypothetical protein ACRD7E_05410, partial [Bryobacteraceae bacterium]
ALDHNGLRLMPLASGRCSSEKARCILSGTKAEDLFPESRAPDAALSGLWLYFSCLDESHSLSQDIQTPEGAFWHGIMHRQEPDAGNSAYWFRRVGRHPVFPELREASAQILEEHPGLTSFKLADTWDPFAFIDFCEQARLKPGSDAEKAAMQMQTAEWQLLFDYCARPAEAAGR